MAFDEAYNEPENVEVLVKSLDPGQPAQLHYAHAGDAGADLRPTEEVTLKPFQRARVPTGTAIALPAGYVALVHPRSGLAVKQGVTVLNAPGTIDAGYRGEIKVPLINLDPERAVTFHPGDRIAQLALPVPTGSGMSTASHSWSSNATSRQNSSRRRPCLDPTARNVASDQPALRPDGTAIHKDRGCIRPCNTRPDTSVIW